MPKMGKRQSYMKSFEGIDDSLTHIPNSHSEITDWSTKPIMLRCNINQPKLRIGTRLQVNVLHQGVVEATTLTYCFQLYLYQGLISNYPFEFKGEQFSVKAINIRKVQGHTLKTAAKVVLMKSYFSDGQLQVACSRAW